MNKKIQCLIVFTRALNHLSRSYLLKTVRILGIKNLRYFIFFVMVTFTFISAFHRHYVSIANVDKKYRQNKLNKLEVKLADVRHKHSRAEL